MTMIGLNVLATTMLIPSSAPAMASVPDPVPPPVAGAAGPSGTAFALAGYDGYRTLRKKD